MAQKNFALSIGIKLASCNVCGKQGPYLQHFILWSSYSSIFFIFHRTRAGMRMHKSRDHRTLEAWFAGFDLQLIWLITLGGLVVINLNNTRNLNNKHLSLTLKREGKGPKMNSLYFFWQVDLSSFERHTFLTQGSEPVGMTSSSP